MAKKPEFVKPDRAEAVVPQPGSYLSQIVGVLNQFGNQLLPLPKGTDNERNSNIGAMLAEAYLWDEVQRYAKRKSDTLWEQMEKDQMYSSQGLEPGVHQLAESRKFVMAAVVTEPVKRFDAKTLAKLLKKKFQVPEPRTIELVEVSKNPTKSQVKLSITER